MRLPLCFPFALSLLAALSVGCNVAQLKPAPDASPGCLGPQIEFGCAEGPVGGAGCTGNLDSTSAFGVSVYVDAGTYPPPCQVLVNSTVADQDNQCTTLGTCFCNGNDAGAFNWVCIASH